MVPSVIRTNLCMAWINFALLIAGYESQTTPSTTGVEAMATHREQPATRRNTQRQQMTATPDSWVSLRDKDYLFVMDTGRRNDLSRDEAKRRCLELGTGLLSVESDDEMEFIRRQIRHRVKWAGQEFAHEQWWTAGMVLGDVWVWDKDDKTPVTVSALKKKEVPKTKEARYLALSHGHDQQGWRLRGLPGNYRLRYICQREPSQNDNPEKLERQLRHFLIRNGRNARKQFSTKAHLSILVDPTRITKLDEEVRQICIMNKFTLEWHDSSVQWNGTRFSNVSSILLSSGQIFIPQVTIFGGILRKKLNAIRGAQVLLTSLGSAQIKVDDELCITCHWSALLFPFDQYKCPVQLESSSNVVSNLLLSPLSPATIESFSTSNWILDRYHQTGRTNCAFDADSAVGRTGTGNVTWDCARLEFHFRRSVALYVAVLLLPLLILTMPLLVLLLVSPSSRLKIPSMLILVVLYSVLLHLSCSIVPVKSSQITVITIYPLSLMVISVSSACVSIVCTRSQREYVTDQKSFVAFCCRVCRSETRHFRKDSCDSFDESDRGRHKTSGSSDAAKTVSTRRGSCRRPKRSLSKSSLQASKSSLPLPVFDGTNEMTYTADKIREQWGVSETPIDAPWATGTIIGDRTSTEETHTNEETSTLKSQTHRTPGAVYRTGSSLEKTVDMAFFVAAVALLVGYAVVIVFASF